MNLTYGSQGAAVKQLQTALNGAGYGLAVDGIYGAKTQAAVRDYQRKNGLSVDGIAGTQTQSKLYGTSGASGTSGTGSTSNAATEPSKEVPKAPDFSYDPATDEAYQNALKNLNDIKGQGAPTYTSTYDQQMSDIYNKIMNRDKFTYDLNEDALYNQYKDQYTQQGRMAMMDTMGQAAALTGGYGSSYGQAVGQQQYDAYLQSLNDIVPDLYSAAYDRYNAEGDQLLRQYQLTGDLRDTEYNRYLDEYNRYMDTLSNLQAQESELYNRGYDNWLNAQDMQYKRQQDAYDKAVSMISTLGYMPSADELALAGMSDAEAQRWLKYYNDQQAAAMYSGGGSGGSRKSGSGSDDSFSPTSPRYNTLLNLINDSAARYSATEKENIVNKYASSGEITESERQNLNALIEAKLDEKMAAYK